NGISLPLPLPPQPRAPAAGQIAVRDPPTGDDRQEANRVQLRARLVKHAPRRSVADARSVEHHAGALRGQFLRLEEKQLRGDSAAAPLALDRDTPMPGVIVFGLLVPGASHDASRSVARYEELKISSLFEGDSLKRGGLARNFGLLGNADLFVADLAGRGRPRARGRQPALENDSEIQESAEAPAPGPLGEAGHTQAASGVAQVRLE